MSIFGEILFDYNMMELPDPGEVVRAGNRHLRKRFALYSWNYDMTQGTWSVYAGLAGHAFQLLDTSLLVNEETTSQSSYPLMLF